MNLEVILEFVAFFLSKHSGVSPIFNKYTEFDENENPIFALELIVK